MNKRSGKNSNLRIKSQENGMKRETNEKRLQMKFVQLPSIFFLFKFVRTLIILPVDGTDQ